MGSSQICNTNTADRKDEVERAAFQHVKSHLQNMPFCSLDDLAQAAKSLLFPVRPRRRCVGHVRRELR